MKFLKVYFNAQVTVFSACCEVSSPSARPPCAHLPPLSHDPEQTLLSSSGGATLVLVLVLLLVLSARGSGSCVKQVRFKLFYSIKVCCLLVMYYLGLP